MSNPTHIRHSSWLPYTVVQSYALVNDIARYPEFLPACKKACIHSHTETSMEATLTVTKGPLSYALTTRNSLTSPSLIEMQLVKGPFRYLKGRWSFKPEKAGCVISLELSFDLSSRLLAMALNPILQTLAERITEAFKVRAQNLYG